MNDAATQINPVDVLAIEFVEGLRHGNSPDIDGFAGRHPELADEILQLFPTIASLERVRMRNDATSGEALATLGPVRLERLGDLRIIREIGRGGMGIVYEAEQESLQRRVAVKVLPKQALLDEMQLRRFQREARTAAKLHHTNIVPILGIGDHDGFHYYVMQKITGVSLEKIFPLISEAAQNQWSTNTNDGLSSDQAIARALVEGRFRGDIEAESLTERESPSSPTPAAINWGQRGAAQSSLSLVVTGDFYTAHMASQNTEGGTENQPLSAVALGDGYWKSVATIGHQVASALEYAHQQGTMHRDIKPANLIIDTQGTVWVADFGLAKAMEQDDVSRTGDIIGTLKYMAPEQLNGHADARSDLYSLGLTLYELVSLESAWSEAESRRRFAAQSASLSPPMLRNHNPAIPRDLETIIHKLIAIEPKHRYQTADQVSADLQRFLGGRPILARRSTPWERLSRWARRNPALAGASGAATLLMCTVALVSTLGYLQVSKANQETKLALHEEQLQRQTADERESLALSALDRIFERFAPGGLPLSVDDSSDDSTPIVSAVLSTEAADLLQELVEYYQKLREQSGDDPAYQKRIAQANRRLGDIDQRLGRYEQAQQAYEQALLLYTQLTVESPGHNRAIAGLHVEIGNTYRQQRQFADAERSYAAAEQLLEPMASQHGGEAAAAELARVYYLQIRGNNRRRRGGRSQTARVAIDREATELKLDRAIQIMDELTLGHPNVTIYAHTLALLYLEASSFHSRENPTDSNGFHERAIVELESLTEMSPTNPEYAFALCGALSTGSSRSNRLSYQDLDSFAERLTRALSAITEIVEAHPQVPEYRDFQARIHQKLGNVLMRLEFYPEAEQRYQAAIDGYGVLASRFPESARQYEMKRVFARQALAGLLMQSDSAEAVTRARDELLAATDTLKSAAADADNPESIQSRLTRCRHQLDECSQQLGRMNHSPSESL